PGSWKSRSRPRIPSARPTTACWSGRRSGRYRSGTACRHRSRLRLWQGGVANAGSPTPQTWVAWANGMAGGAAGTGRRAAGGGGEAVAAGVLAALPALVGVGSPSVASYLRLVPSHWAGAYQVWGKENREAALRLVTGSSGEQDVRANIEVKCFDLAANPYLAIGAVLATGL